MSIRLAQLQRRVEELEQTANRIQELAQRHAQLQDVQPELQNITQQWYRGARELLTTNGFSGLAEFESCYEDYRDTLVAGKKDRVRVRSDIETFTRITATGSQGFTSVEGGLQNYKLFLERLRKARALVLSCSEEIKSRELPIKSQLSFEVADDEFTTAVEMLDTATDETLIRAAGVIGRVALERHLWTVTELHNVTITKNPPHKKRADTQDLLTALGKARVITAIQKSELDGLFTVGNNCAHPKEQVNKTDVQRLLARGRELASVIS